MAFSELERAYPLFDWEVSNGEASGAQTRTAYWALGNKGECARFSYLVWNDMVAALAALQKELGVSWDGASARMSVSDKALTAARFNAFRENMDLLWRPGWPWALPEKPDWLEYPEASFLGRAAVVGAAQAGENADVVYGWYLLELVRRMNILIRLLRGEDVGSEMAYRGLAHTLKGASAVAAGGFSLEHGRKLLSRPEGWLLPGLTASMPVWSPSRTVSRGELHRFSVANMEHLDAAQGRQQVLADVVGAAELRHESGIGLWDGAAFHPWGAVPIGHAGESRLGQQARAVTAQAVQAAHRGEAESGGCASVDAAGAVFVRLRGGSGSGLEAGAALAAPVFAGAAQESQTQSGGSMIAPRLDALRWLDIRQRSESTVEGQAETALPLGMRERRGPGFVCLAKLASAGVASSASVSASRTKGFAALGFEGETETVWLAPVRNGNDLYIRSVWRARQEGSNLDIDRAVFYEPIRNGNDLYIRSAKRLWTEGSGLHIDRAVFYEPVRNGNGLYIRSRASMEGVL